MFRLTDGTRIGRNGLPQHYMLPGPLSTRGVKIMDDRRQGLIMSPVKGIYADLLRVGLGVKTLGYCAAGKEGIFSGVWAQDLLVGFYREMGLRKDLLLFNDQGILISSDPRQKGRTILSGKFRIVYEAEGLAGELALTDKITALIEIFR